MAENERMKKFRGSIGGYAKKDVNGYIEKISLDFSNQCGEYEEKLSKAERETASEREKNRDLSKRIDELACEAYENGIKYSSEKLAREEAETKLDELAFEVYSHTEKEKELCKTAEELRKKVEKYELAYGDDLPEDILEIINSRAEEMLSAAKEKCDSMINEAREEADRIRAEAEESADKSKERMRAECKDAATEYYDEVLSFAQDIRVALNTLMCDISRRGEELGQRIDYMRLENENSARKEGAVIESLPEKSGPKTDLPEKKSSKVTVSFSSIDKKLEAFVKNAISAINDFRDKK